MKVKFLLEERESRFLKEQFLTAVSKQFGAKVTVGPNAVEVEDKDAPRVVEMLSHSGLRYERTEP